jgi:hypothetical protein
VSLDVQSATRELAIKNAARLHRETAHTWAARAVAAYALFQRTRKLQWLLDGEEYAHEALEHASLAEPELAARLRDPIERARALALSARTP